MAVFKVKAVVQGNSVSLTSKRLIKAMAVVQGNSGSPRSKRLSKLIALE